MVNKLLKAYYGIKPLIPRWAQLAMRRIYARPKLIMHRHVWPIDPNAAKPPSDWQGWPDGKRFAFLITHDVDTGRGQDNCRTLVELEREMGFRGSYNFVPERYAVREELRKYLTENGLEVGVHGLKHDGKYYNSREIFERRSKKINRYIQDWDSVGFRSPSMLHDLDWIHALDIAYDSSTFDTDPFEPQPDGVASGNGKEGYVEIPYTLPQDFTLFILLRQKSIDIWKRKLDWIASKGGMALMLVHPDYVDTGEGKCGPEKYPLELYADFLRYVRDGFDGQYYHALPRDLARFWKERYVRSGCGL
jgi:hypothetical protein